MRNRVPDLGKAGQKYRFLHFDSPTNIPAVRQDNAPLVLNNVSLLMFLDHVWSLFVYEILHGKAVLPSAT